MAYTTQPGTISHLTIEHLKSLPPGTELSTVEIAEAINQPANYISSCLDAPREHGAIIARKVGHIYRWSLGPGVIERETGDEKHPVVYKTTAATKQQAEEPTTGTEKQPQNARKSPKKPPQRTQEATAKETPHNDNETQQKPQNQETGIIVGCYSDGGLSIMVGGTKIYLTPSKFDELLQFAERFKKGKK